LDVGDGAEGGSIGEGDGAEKEEGEAYEEEEEEDKDGSLFETKIEVETETETTETETDEDGGEKFNQYFFIINIIFLNENHHRHHHHHHHHCYHRYHDHQHCPDNNILIKFGSLIWHGMTLEGAVKFAPTTGYHFQVSLKTYTKLTINAFINVFIFFISISYRHVLTVVHFNFNMFRDVKHRETDGVERVKVSYPLNIIC